MTKYKIRKRTKHHFRQIKAHIRKPLHVPHSFMSDNIGLYRWWHEQDIHGHIHYAAMSTGMILAVYYVMLDGILQEINVSATALVNLIK